MRDPTLPDVPYDPTDPSTWRDSFGDVVPPIDPGSTTSTTDPSLAHLTNPVFGGPGTANGALINPQPSQVGAPGGGDWTQPGWNVTTSGDNSNAVWTGPGENPNYQVGSPEDLAYKAAHPTAPAPVNPSSGSASGANNPNNYVVPPITIDPATTANNKALRDFMMGQLGTLSTPMDVNNPEVKPAIDAYNAQSQRDQQTDRNTIAERYYGLGEGGSAIDTGGFNTAVQQNLEAGAASRANFTGSTIYNAAQAQRTQLQAMLNTAVNAGQVDVAQQIQTQIAQIDAGLREQGLGQQNQQFYDSLGTNIGEFNATMSRDALLHLFGL